MKRRPYLLMWGFWRDSRTVPQLSSYLSGSTKADRTPGSTDTVGYQPQAASAALPVPGRRLIRQRRACCLLPSFCCWLRGGEASAGRCPPGHTASWMTRRYTTQYLVHVRLATPTSSHLRVQTHNGQPSEPPDSRSVSPPAWHLLVTPQLAAAASGWSQTSQSL